MSEHPTRVWSVVPRVAPGRTPASSHARTVLATASAGFFLITLDISIVNVALARIQAELGAGTVGQQWIIDGYTLVFAALLLFAGNLADRIGARRAFAVGVAVFTLASLACAAAPTAWTLVAARCVQGAGAAVMLPASMALVRAAFTDGPSRARALGVWAVGGAVAGLVGQPLGGVLTTLDWRWVFLVNVPVCVAMLCLLTRVEPSGTRRVRFDWPGQLLALVVLTALVYGLIDGGHRGFTSAPVLVALVVTVVALAAFLRVQSRSDHPMMPLGLFHARGFRIALPVGFAFMVGNYGNVFVSSLFLQQHLGASPLRAGLAFLPSAAFAVVGNLTSGPITNRFGPRLPIVGGLLLMVAGLTGLVLTAQHGSLVLVALLTIPIGAGGSLAMPPVTGVVLDGVDADLAGTASAVFNTVRQVGGAVAIAVFGALVADPATFVGGLRVSFVVAATLLLVTALLSLRIGRTPPAPGPTDP